MLITHNSARTNIIVLVTILLTCVVNIAQAQHAPENQLKAALIFNFALFTEWQQSSLPEKGELNLCVVKHTLVSDALAELAGKTINGHPLRIKFLSDGVDNWRNCRLAYLEGDEHLKLSVIRKKIDNFHVLTISDSSTALEEGIMIVIATEDNRFVFDINATAVRQAKLNISSKLLRLARKVL